MKGARGGLILFVALLVVTVAAAWFLHNFHRVEHELDLPPRGEAAYNPLYALKLALQADGVRVDSRQRLNLAAHPLQPGDTVLLLNDPRSLSPPDAQRLLDWVAGGGHLIVRTPDLKGWQDSLTPALFETLGLFVKGHDAGGSTDCMSFQVEGEDHHIEFCGKARFSFDDVVPELSWGNLGDGYVYARLAHGDGRVDVLSGFDFLSNRRAGGGLFGGTGVDGGLHDGPHRALTRQVLAPNYGKGTMHLVYAAQMPSLFRSLFERGWRIWLPLALALLAWLWMRSQRFGPALPPPPGERRSLLEHVRASGEHLFRYNKRALLYAAVRQAFLSRLRRRDPLAAALDGDAQAEAIAARLQVPAASLRDALQAPASHDTGAFRDRISTLIRLRRQL
ncbi:hypothetical protein CSC70_01405 [Pseudoxanthomonas kalamensis DSM 18571]|nr:hypothetical protein CSC70_01405 [Pseudoxanthomonas kalamensis DSM 18571]